MKFKTLFTAMAVLLSAPSYAAIANGLSGNGELFLVVQDAGNKVSFTFDMGVRMDDFQAVGETIGYTRSWDVGSDANWTNFVGAASSLATATWAVIALDSTGSNTQGNQRALTTVRAGQEAAVGNWQNVNFSAGIGGAQAGNFFNAVNSTGTHLPFNDFAGNGSSVNLESDSGRAYFGEIGGLTPTFNGSATFSNNNLIGTSASFVYATRSSTSNLASARVLVNVFDNQFGAASFNFDGNTVAFAAPVPEASSYALMLAGLGTVGFLARRRRRA